MRTLFSVKYHARVMNSVIGLGLKLAGSVVVILAGPSRKTGENPLQSA
jgi:hypothetical protein